MKGNSIEKRKINEEFKVISSKTPVGLIIKNQKINASNNTHILKCKPWLGRNFKKILKYIFHTENYQIEPCLSVMVFVLKTIIMTMYG